MKISTIYRSDDYCVLDNGVYTFYYGYEKTFCNKHGYDSDCDCDDQEWCFVVSENNKEICSIPATELELNFDGRSNMQIEDYLLVGIGTFLQFPFMKSK